MEIDAHFTGLFRIFSYISLVALAVLSLIGCKGSETSVGENVITYSVFLGRGEDSSYYSDYSENPILPYYEDKTYAGEDGSNVKVNLKFQIPASGSESDNLNILIATGDYPDVIDTTYYKGTVMDLYDDSVAMDITDYVNQYMPNYLSYLDSHPEVALTATNIIDGEKKIIQIYGFNTRMTEWQGLVYRRDWIVKYGKNPSTGKPFSGEFTEKLDDGTWNQDSWSDDVVFPSGGPDPIYISDWEWMFRIFSLAFADLGIEDGYCTSIYYTGVSRMGILNSAFGGGGVQWYKNLDGKIEFGGENEALRTYLECLSNWYQKGWLDPRFAQNSNVMPWRIDEAMVRQGKVGLWHGMDSQLFTRLDLGDPLTKGIMVYACSYPINDVYGSEDVKYHKPYHLFQQSPDGTSFIITDSMKEKDMVAFFRFMDGFYDKDNSLMLSNGYSRDDIKTYPNDFYTEHGLGDGAYYSTGEVNDEGQEIDYKNDILFKDPTLMPPSALGRIWGLQGDTPTKIVVDRTETDQMRHMKYLWGDLYKNTGNLSQPFYGQLGANDAKNFFKIQKNIDEFMSKNIPPFIFGWKDPLSDEDWDAYKNAIEKYRPEMGTKILQETLDVLQGE